MSSFGKNLKRIRTQKNMSQDEFAALLGTSKQVISRYENDQRSPKVSIVAEYANKLGVSIGELSGEDRPLPANVRPVFVKNLNRYMKMRGVDQSDIVNALDVSASTVSDWATGKKYPRVDSMQRLADFLGVLLSDLTVESHSVSPSDPQEQELLTIYRGLNEKGQDMLINTARSYASNSELKKGWRIERRNGMIYLLRLE